jgi:hypothetical protein
MAGHPLHFLGQGIKLLLKMVGNGYMAVQISAYSPFLASEIFSQAGISHTIQEGCLEGVLFPFAEKRFKFVVFGAGCGGQHRLPPVVSGEEILAYWKRFWQE